MILSELRCYLQERRRVALPDLVNRFDMDADALRGMLSVLERKGRIRKLPAMDCSSGCNKCDQASIEIYEAVESEGVRAPQAESAF